MQMVRLNELRKKIDMIDKQVVSLLLQRFKIAKQISLYKKKVRISVKDSKRESQILKNVLRFSKNNEFVIKMFRSIINYSRKIQK